MQFKRGTFFSKVLNNFPPPKILAVPACGIDVSDATVKFIEIEGTHGKARISKFGEERIPPGVVEGGEVKDPKRLSKALIALKEKHSLHSAHASLPEEKGYLFELQINPAEAGNLGDAISFKLEENVPLPASEIVFDYDILQFREGENVRVSVTAMPREVVERYGESFDRAGLFLESLEIEAQAIARSVIPFGDTEPYMIVDFGRSRIGVAVVSHEAVRFTSTIDMGGNGLTEIIAKHYKLDRAEAEKIKESSGLYDHENKEVVKEMLLLAKKMADELEKRLTFGSHSFGRDHRAIERLVLCGGNATVPGLREFLMGRFNVQVEIPDVWQNVFSVNDFLPDIRFGESLGFATSVGLALKSRK